MGKNADEMARQPNASPVSHSFEMYRRSLFVPDASNCWTGFLAGRLPAVKTSTGKSNGRGNIREDYTILSIAGMMRNEGVMRR